MKLTSSEPLPFATTPTSSRGGHCAFVEPPNFAKNSTSAQATADKSASEPNRFDGYFAEKTVIDFLVSKGLEPHSRTADTPRHAR